MCSNGTLSDHLIQARVVIGIRESALQKKLLERKDLTLNSCIDTCRASESTSKQVRDINQAEFRHVVRAAKQSLMRSKQVMTAKSSQTYDRNARNALPTISRKFCGKTHIWKKGKCLTWGKQCTKCGTRNHFAIKCPQTTCPGTVNMLALAQDEYLEDPDEYALALDKSANDGSNGSFPKKRFARLVNDNSTLTSISTAGQLTTLCPLIST